MMSVPEEKHWGDRIEDDGSDRPTVAAALALRDHPTIGMKACRSDVTLTSRNNE